MKQQQRRRSILVDTIAAGLCLLGLYWFAASFFLAKKSLAERSSCEEAPDLLREVLQLDEAEIYKLMQTDLLSMTNKPIRQGCWMSRKVDSVVVLVVDALRFDFAYYNLPQSIGSRLLNGSSKRNNSTASATSRLFQFLADPPTVTMQRLKGLTTGGLPTFADISGNFGGATVEEDSWLWQLKRQNNWQARGLSSQARAGFVGDDTWQDLFPNYFDESFPYPSFNTRDLDTVDNGCLKHIPYLLQHIRGTLDDGNTPVQEQEDGLEVMVVHFLGVDHVGHTYGPHNEHMDAKLKQMDTALSSVLQKLDASRHCHTTLIFGDHGMTPDGNHGGGTEEETHAALFVHTSPACGDMTDATYLEQKVESDLIQAAFASVHQIDLVPTLSLLLGLPIPYANLGSLIPSLIPHQDVREMTVGLALNAAQVWRYFTVYSSTANRLPNLGALQTTLQVAVAAFKDALSHIDDPDTEKFDQSAALFKSFLNDALELGHRVWTRFDSVGMVGGIIVLTIGLVMYVAPLAGALPSMMQTVRYWNPIQVWEVGVSLLAILFQFGLLTFSNSYIYEEERTIVYFLSLLYIIIGLQVLFLGKGTLLPKLLFVLPIATRVGELYVTGHGLDPSIRLHNAHNTVAWGIALLLLCSVRIILFRTGITSSAVQCLIDLMSFCCLGASWWEKRDMDPERNGYYLCRAAICLVVTSFIAFSFQSRVGSFKGETKTQGISDEPIAIQTESIALTLLAKLFIGIMIVTGPSAASTLVLYVAAIVAVFSVASQTEIQSISVASTMKLLSRFTFFSTNHGCSFSRLLYSSAFVATKEFYFVLGGTSLFLNTFGWEMAGLGLAWLLSRRPGRSSVWRIYCACQYLEALTSCISVSLLRRHLMVWDIYAPHFLFVCVFTILTGAFQVNIFALVN